MTFCLGHALFYRSMETFLVNFLKVFSQDHHGKRLLSNHNANQWYMNTRPNALYLLYLLRCQIETKSRRCALYNHVQKEKTQRQEQKERTGDGATMFHRSRLSICLLPLDISFRGGYEAGRVLNTATTQKNQQTRHQHKKSQQNSVTAMDYF